MTISAKISFNQDLEYKMRAAYPGIYIVAREEWRCIQEVNKIADKLGIHHRVWTVSNGWGEVKSALFGQGGDKTKDPLQAIETVKGEDGIFSFLNFHRYLDDPEMIMAIKDTLQIGKGAGTMLCFVSSKWEVPDELVSDLSRSDFELPDRDLLAERMDYLLDSLELPATTMGQEKRDSVVEAALGMTTWEAENAMSLSVVEQGSINPAIVSREKAIAVAKSGILEFVSTDLTMNDVGGQDLLKQWMAKRRKGFSKLGREFGLPQPKGVLVIGPPGTGKSLSAKAAANALGIPLIRFDVGKAFAGIVGATEENFRRVQSLAEAIAPVVLWIDEIGDAFAGTNSSGTTDSGVTARAAGGFLTWMQEHTRPVFVFATANNLAKVPPQMLRRGRWDGIFTVDLPGETERIEIMSIHLSKRKRAPDQFNLTYVAKETTGFSGAELESLIVEGLYAAFDEDRELMDDDLIEACHSIIPLSVSMQDDIQRMRDFAQKFALPASSSPPPRTEDEGVYQKRRIRVTSILEEDD